MTAQTQENFITAIGEAFANAIEHAGGTADVEIAIERRDTHLVATIRDHGRGIDASCISATLPSVTTERGRGIPLMRQCSDSMSIQNPSDGGTLVVLDWKLSLLEGPKRRNALA
jgi:anti-sigma regulatory factor (Ser/Thr protein kinase)